MGPGGVARKVPLREATKCKNSQHPYVNLFMVAFNLYGRVYWPLRETRQLHIIRLHLHSNIEYFCRDPGSTKWADKWNCSYGARKEKESQTFQIRQISRAIEYSNYTVGEGSA